MYKEPDVIAAIPQPTKEAVVYKAYEKGEINNIVANIQRDYHHVQPTPGDAAVADAAAAPQARGGRRRS
ncbi:hypothetical protein HDU77_011868, partial [Chytriomyces hyalinus]